MRMGVESVSVRTAAAGRWVPQCARKEVDIDEGHRAGHTLDIAAEEAPVAVEADIRQCRRE